MPSRWARRSGGPGWVESPPVRGGADSSSMRRRSAGASPGSRRDDRRGELGKDAVGQAPVLDCIRNTGRDTDVVFEHQPSPIDIANDVEPADVRAARPGRPAEGAVSGRPAHEPRRKDAVTDDCRVAVDVLQERVERPRPLRGPSLDAAPLFAGQDARHEVDRKGAGAHATRRPEDDPRGDRLALERPPADRAARTRPSRRASPASSRAPGEAGRRPLPPRRTRTARIRPGAPALSPRVRGRGDGRRSRPRGARRHRRGGRARGGPRAGVRPSCRARAPLRSACGRRPSRRLASSSGSSSVTRPRTTTAAGTERGPRRSTSSASSPDRAARHIAARSKAGGGAFDGSPAQ